MFESLHDLLVSLWAKYKINYYHLLTSVTRLDEDQTNQTIHLKSLIYNNSVIKRLRNLGSTLDAITRRCVLRKYTYIRFT